MKKLRLKNLKLEANDMLQRNQLKTVLGGYGGYGGPCDDNPSGSCGYNNAMGEICGLSEDCAKDQVAQFGGNWCCESCAGNGGSASYC